MTSDTAKIRDLESAGDNELTHAEQGQQLLNEEEDDVSTSVSSNTYELSFEEAAAVTPAAVESETGLMNYYIPNTRHLPAIVRKISEENEMSFNVIARIGIIHGYSIFRHEHADFIALMRALDDAAVSELNDTYLGHLNHKVGIGKDIKRLPVGIEKTLMQEMGEISALVGTSRSHLAGACLMMSLLTSESVNKKAKKYLETQLKGFRIDLKMFETCANVLTATP